MSEQNLSQKLFSKSKKDPETSTLIQIMEHRGKRAYRDDQSVQGWYRVLKRPQWIWTGVDAIDQEEILARIAANDGHRSYEYLLDTVAGYIPGNWAYEWTKSGMVYQKLAQQQESDGKQTEAGFNFIKASTYYSIAAYPYLSNDILADQATVFANKAYEKAADLLPYQIEKIEIKQGKQSTQALLHLPDDIPSSPLPVIIVCGGLEISHPELWRIYQQVIRPKGWAMVSLDMPSFGYSSNIPLTEDSSAIHQTLLDKIDQHPYLDHDNIFAFGIRFGANILTRLAYMEPKRVKGVISLSPICHHFLTREYQKSYRIPDMFLDLVASRLRKQHFQRESLLGLLNAWSLKTQGLLGIKKLPVPFLAMTLKNDPVCPPEEVKLVARSSSNGSYKIFSDQPLHEGYQNVINHAIEWIDKHIR